MNRTQTEALLRRLRGAYGRRWDTETLDEWARQLERVDAELANLALDDIIAAGEDGPTVARLRRAIRDRTPTRPPERTDECMHDHARSDGALAWSCPDCGAVLLAGTHPTAIAAFERGLAQARAERARRLEVAS